MTTSTAGETTFTTPSDREIEMSRLFDAPRELVFEAFTTPEHLSQWFGPRGWSVPLCEIDLRPGGAWRYILRGPNGEEMGMSGVYREIAPPERVVTTESFDDYPGESLNTLRLTEEAGKTRYTVNVLYADKETRDAVLASGMSEGASETLERLAERLESLQEK